MNHLTLKTCCQLMSVHSGLAGKRTVSRPCSMIHMQTNADIDSAVKRQQFKKLNLTQYPIISFQVLLMVFIIGNGLVAIIILSDYLLCAKIFFVEKTCSLRARRNDEDLMDLCCTICHHMTCFTLMNSDDNHINSIRWRTLWDADRISEHFKVHL